MGSSKVRGRRARTVTTVTCDVSCVLLVAYGEPQPSPDRHLPSPGRAPAPPFFLCRPGHRPRKPVATVLPSRASPRAVAPPAIRCQTRLAARPVHVPQPHAVMASTDEQAVIRPEGTTRHASPVPPAVLTDHGDQFFRLARKPLPLGDGSRVKCGPASNGTIGHGHWRVPHACAAASDKKTAPCREHIGVPIVSLLTARDDGRLAVVQWEEP